ncbi:RICIN domain-containing protein [Streptacidiphilus albus]|uniref:RICIN domain-containing protein n=1 Tax=Streptacidiphilus albus TaxID=105425 RepID=UPI00054BD1EB|nr:RICIN domain-containing protein [Streptacidiphilus albus]
MNAKRIALIVGAFFSVATLSLANASFASADTASGHLWNASPSSNECLAAAGNKHDSDVIMWTCDGEAGQQWYAAPHNNGNAANDITIKNGNGDCLGVMDDSETEGAQVVAWSCDQNSDQDWSVQSNTGSTMVLVNERNPLNCLSVSGGSTANGANAITWNCYDYTADQQWSSAVGDNAFADEQSLQN